MPKTIDAIYENGVFKPLEKVNIKPQKKIKLVIFPSEEDIPNLVKSQKKFLSRLCGIGKSKLGNLSLNHDKHFKQYGKITVVP